MQKSMKSILKVTSVAIAAAVLAGCSGSTEDVRVTLCKNLTTALQGTDAIEWGETEFAFRRPEYATTTLHYELESAAGDAKTSACHFAYEALDDTAVNLANPISAYETLPFAMTVNDRVLSDAELLNAVNTEQQRLGRQALSSLDQSARDLAEKIRAGLNN